MSTTVDNRVVEMQFDNKNFESNVQTTISSLNKLKQSLNLTGATKGLENVDAAAKKVDMSPLGNAVQSVQAKFSVMQTMATTALVNITNQAVNAGKRIVSALTIDPIMAGFSEYELKMGSVQTILANTSHQGTTLDDVTATLDDLNTYADKTIYNFAEMTRNIGTFTAAGVDLDTSATSIKGIANLAAVSGSTSQQASTAMYQLSQALAAGKVSLMDWNSVVNAGMGGKVFQDALKRTAENQGKDVDAMIKKYGSFRESLTQGEWLTADVLTETLSQLAGAYTEKDLLAKGYTKEQAKEILALAQTAEDAATKVKTVTQLFDTLKESAQSGWAQTWEILVGDFEEAKELLTSISDVVGGFINATSEARNKVLQGWKDLGGRTALIEALTNIFKGLFSVIKPIKDAFIEIFPPVTAEMLFNLTDGLLKFSEKLKLSETASANLKDTFKGLFAILNIIRRVFVSVIQIVGKLIGVFTDTGGGLLEIILGITGAFGRWLVKIDEAIGKSEFFNKVVEKISGFIKSAGDAINGFFDKITGFDFLEKRLGKVGDKMSSIKKTSKEMGEGFSSAIDSMHKAFTKSNFMSGLESLWNGIKTVVGDIADAVANVIGAFVSGLGKLDFSGLLDFVNSLAVGGMAVGITKFFNNLGDSVSGIKNVVENAGDVLNNVFDVFKAYQQQLQAKALMEIAKAIALLAVAILIISTIDSKKLAGSLAAITALFADLMGSMMLFSKFGGALKGAFSTIAFMNGLATAILILAFALRTIASLSVKQLAKGVAGVTALAGVLVGASVLMGKYAKKGIKHAFSLVIFAGAIMLLGKTIEQIGDMRWQDIVQGLGSVVIVVGALVGASVLTGRFAKGGIQHGFQLIMFAGAILLLGKTIEQIGDMRWQDIVQGLGSVILVIAALTDASVLIGRFAKDGIQNGFQLVMFAGALMIIGKTIEQIGDMRWQDIVQGLGSVILVIASLTAASILISKFSSGGIKGAWSMVIFAGAITIIGKAIEQIGGMRWQDIVQGLGALAGAMVILAVGLHAMNGSLAGSAALIVAAGAISVLTPALKTLGSMKWESIAKGLVAIAGAFAVIGLAGLILKPLIPAILGLAASFVLIGVSVLAIGAGLAAVGAGLSLVAVGITALASAVSGGVVIIVTGIKAVATALITLIPMLARELAAAVIAFCEVIAEGAPTIGKAAKEVILSIVDVLVECVPEIVDGTLKLIDGVLSSLVKYAPKIVKGLFDFIISLIDALADKIPDFIKSFVNLFSKIFSGVVDALKGIDTKTLIEGLVGIGLMAGIMIALSAVAGMIPGAMVGVLGMGLVIAELALVLAAIGGLAQIPGLKWLIDEGAVFMESVGNAIGSFIGGIVGGIVSGVTGQLPQIGNDLSSFMKNIQPFIDGAKNINASTLEGVEALAKTILILTAADVLDGLTSWFTGGSSLAEFGEEISTFGPYIKAFADDVEGINAEAVSAASKAAKALAEMASTVPNEGGLAAWFAGENSLASFGDGIELFGSSLKAYSDNVVGVDAANVTNSVTAAKALVDMSNNVPNEGGLAAWFAGENSLATYGNKMVSFGFSLRLYSMAVAGINTEAVVNSANAAKSIVDLSNNIPNEGGLAAWFTGENCIANFGSKLVQFGMYFALYSSAISGIDTKVVTATSAAARSIVSLAKAIPEDKFFTNETTLDEFGSQLSKFGGKFATFYSKISGIDAGLLSSVISQINKLVKMARGMSGLDTDAVGSFGDSLTKLGKTGINGFLNAFRNSSSKINASASVMMQNLVKGIKSKQSSMLVPFKTMINACVVYIKGRASTFRSAGTSLITNFIGGIRSGLSNFTSLFKTMISMCVLMIRSKYNSFETAGKYLGSGFVLGIRSKIKSAYDAGYDMGAKAAQGVKDGEKSKSPSKEGIKAGKYLGEGVVIGINEMGKSVYSAGYNMGDTAVKSLSNSFGKISDVINNDIDAQPTIRPVLDLTEIQNGASGIDSMFSNQTLSVDSVVDRASGLDGSGNSGSYDIVSAINKLRTDISNMRTTENNLNFNGAMFNNDERITSIMNSLMNELVRKGAMG